MYRIFSLLRKKFTHNLKRVQRENSKKGGWHTPPFFYLQNALTEKKDESFSTFPLIGAYNGYLFDGNPAFFLIASMLFYEKKGSFLTLDAFRFQNHDVKKLFVSQSPANRAMHLEALCKQIAGLFGKSKSRVNGYRQEKKPEEKIKFASEAVQNFKAFKPGDAVHLIVWDEKTANGDFWMKTIGKV